MIERVSHPTSRKFSISSQMRFFLNSVARSLRSQVCLFSVARLLRSQIFNTGPIHDQFCKGIKAMEAICHRKLFKFPLWHQKFPPKSKISLQIICWSAKVSGCGAKICFIYCSAEKYIAVRRNSSQVAVSRR